MCSRPGLDVPPYVLHPGDCSVSLPYRHPIGAPGCVLPPPAPIDPEPDYDEPDPEPVDDADLPPGACWCHDAAPCPDVERSILSDRDPDDDYRDRC